MTKINSNRPVIIAGGGVIGLAIGWRLARAGAAVKLFEKNTVGRGASWNAAGMLAPLSEVGFEEQDFLKIGRESLRRFPEFLDELKKDAGIEVPLDTRGTLIIGLDRDDKERLRRLHGFREHLGLPIEWLSGTAAREIEPLISPRASSAIWIPDDHQIDNRLLVEALKTAFENCGGELHEHCAVKSIRTGGRRLTGVATDTEEFGASAHHLH